MTHPRVWKHAFGTHRIDFVFAQVRYDTLVAEPLATGLAVEADCLARVQHAVVRVATSGQPAVLTPTCRTVACNGGENRREGCDGAAPRALFSSTSWCLRPRFRIEQLFDTVRARKDPGQPSSCARAPLTLWTDGRTRDVPKQVKPHDAPGGPRDILEPPFGLRGSAAPAAAGPATQQLVPIREARGG